MLIQNVKWEIEQPDPAAGSFYSDLIFDKLVKSSKPVTPVDTGVQNQLK